MGHDEDINPFDSNPFMRGSGGKGAAAGPPPSADGKAEARGGPAGTGMDMGMDMDGPVEGDVLSAIIASDPDADAADGDPGSGDTGLQEPADTAPGADADADDPVGAPGGAEGDEGYGAAEKRSRRGLVIIVSSIIALVLAALLALVWVLATNPLHIGDPGVRGARDEGYSQTQEYRGSKCMIDGQSCSSDDNGNHP